MLYSIIIAIVFWFATFLCLCRLNKEHEWEVEDRDEISGRIRGNRTVRISESTKETKVTSVTILLLFVATHIIFWSKINSVIATVVVNTFWELIGAVSKIYAGDPWSPGIIEPFAAFFPALFLLIGAVLLLLSPQFIAFLLRGLTILTVKTIGHKVTRGY
jgi:hypothetical protein